jgi:ParB-like chromosome segregation protein Spo0J
MKVEIVDINKLVQDPSNARKHNERNIDSIKGSLKLFGQQKPIVVDKDNVIIAGNGTYEAAKSLGLTSLAVVRSDLVGTNRTAYALADNRTAELAEWETDSLSQLLAALKDDDFPIEDIGFDTAFEPNLGDTEEKEPEEKFILQVEFKSMEDLDGLFNELNDRKFKVKIKL